MIPTVSSSSLKNTQASSSELVPTMGPGKRKGDVYVEVTTMHAHEMTKARSLLREFEVQGDWGLLGYASPSDIKALDDAGIVIDEVRTLDPTIEKSAPSYPARAVLSTKGPMTGERQAALEGLGVTVEGHMSGSMRRRINYDASTYAVSVPNASAWTTIAEAGFVGTLRVFNPAKDIHPSSPY